MTRTMLLTATAAALLATGTPALSGGLNGFGDVRAQGNVQASLTARQMAQLRSYLDVIAALEANGYVVDQVKRTFLGRVKITARNASHLRQLVVSRATGEIMSDQVVRVYAGTEGESAASAGASAGGSANANANANVSAGADVSAGGGGSAGVGAATSAAGEAAAGAGAAIDQAVGAAAGAAGSVGAGLGIGN